MFKIGQKVVYITGLNMPKGSIHVVSDVYQSECGCSHIAINGQKLQFKPSYGIPIRCNTHNTFFRSSHYHSDNGWDPESFRALDESFAEEVLEMIKEQINEEELITT